MNKQELKDIAAAFAEDSAGNYIDRQTAISEKVSGMKIYEAPLIGIGSSGDPWFEEFRKPSIIGPHFILPLEWLPEARTVISVFLPFSETVRHGASRGSWPSEEWLHGRIEGQAFVNLLCRHLMAKLRDSGYKSVTPGLDERFWAKMAPDPESSHPDLCFTSAWSERHVAFICGLGTFGMSCGLITARGMAGRFGSILTDLELEPDARVYIQIQEYCDRCGTCARNCPVQAISVDNGKNHALCSAFLDKTLDKFKPRFGCNKCQTGVPCESQIPAKSGSEA